MSEPIISNPILLDFSEQMETARLILRANSVKTLHAFHEAVVESFEQLNAWLPWARSPQSIDETKTFLRKSEGDFILRSTLGFTLFRKEDERLVGSMGVHPLKWSVPSFEIGYWTRSSEAGKGYMSEAVAHMTAYLEQTVGARRMLIRCDSRNIGSASVARKCGYTLQGTFHNFDRDNQDRLFDLMHWERWQDKADQERS